MAFALLFGIASLVALYGTIALALSLERNWALVEARPLPRGRRKALRLAGWSALAVALAALIWADGASFAVLSWLLVLATSAILVALVLAYRPGLLLPMVRAFSPRD